MGCCSRSRKTVNLRADQKWEYINLNDFKSRGCFPPFAYTYLWFSLLLSVAVYAVDTFTAVNLLAFNQWSSQIKPAIDFEVSKWIFSVCIILSFINLGFEHFRAMKVMKRGNIAECYLDDLAVRLESIRFGKGQGWRRFLVFTELTKSKKGADYIALFTYFSFQSWIRVLVCSGPRQVVNAFTLKAVYELQIDAKGDNVGDGILDFFDKIGQLADDDYQQTLILSGMCFTLVVWIFSFLFLLLAIIFYLVFLWHWIPRADGGLGGYCERKINKALSKVVTKKVNKAIQQEQVNRFKAEAKAMKSGEKVPLQRQATLPTLPNVELVGGDRLPEMPTLQRNDTTTTLPLYTSRPGTSGSFELNNLDQKRPLPARTGTMSSSTTYSSRAPLMGGASDMGLGPQSPASVPSTDLHNYPPIRPGTSNSQRSLSRPHIGHMPSNSSSSFGAPYTETPATYSSETMPPFPHPVRSPTARTMDGYGHPLPRDNLSRPSPTGRPPFERNSGSDGRASPAPSQFSNRGGPMPRNPGPANPPTYQPYHPNRSVTGPVPNRALPSPPHRNMTAPMPQRQQTGDYFDRQRPSQGSGFSYDYDVEGQRDRRY